MKQLNNMAIQKVMERVLISNLKIGNIIMLGKNTTISYSNSKGLYTHKINFHPGIVYTTAEVIKINKRSVTINKKIRKSSNIRLPFIDQKEISVLY